MRDFPLLICCRSSEGKFQMQLKIVEDCGTRLFESGASAALQIAAAYRLPPHEGVPTDDRKRRLTICCAIATPM
jgi:hypothetical protein